MDYLWNAILDQQKTLRTMGKDTSARIAKQSRQTNRLAFRTEKMPLFRGFFLVIDKLYL